MGFDPESVTQDDRLTVAVFCNRAGHSSLIGKKILPKRQFRAKNVDECFVDREKNACLIQCINTPNNLNKGPPQRMQNLNLGFSRRSP